MGTRRSIVAVAAAAAVAFLTTNAVTGPGASALTPPVLARSTVPVPAVEGPITGPGSPSIIGTSFDLAPVGYQEDEYFISGTATSYALVGRAPADGRWKVTRRSKARYKTRLLVYRPSDPRRFNGTVVVEWLNESAGSDTAADWIGDHTQLIRQGFAWVGVSAQALGVNGGTGVLAVGGKGLKKTNPPRYGTLHHPGDAFSYDIYSQAAQAIRHPRATSPLGRLKAKAVIADGESQSAFFLTTYIDAVAPSAHVFNGYLVHSRFSGGTSLSGSLALAVHEPFRTDLGVPVLAFETETDLTLGDYASNRQPDNRWFRDWEVAGTAHADDYMTGVGLSDDGRSNVAGAIVTHDTPLTIVGCTSAPNAGPQHWVLDAAFSALNRWIRTGEPAAHGPRIDVTPGGPHPTIVRDAMGNARGGIRTPELDVPIVALSGTAATGQSATCSLFGATTPFDRATLSALYPTHADYVAKFDRATEGAVRAGFILPADASQIEAAAAASNVP
ncbi:MAG TPA: alpha/beta hydrolase domain-containing protein [Acidimicrobiales bacterium]|nr:alpha/beta hydrolase domain-containing protein [Acidimicrobiales bacterium]